MKNNKTDLIREEDEELAKAIAEYMYLLSDESTIKGFKDKLLKLVSEIDRSQAILAECEGQSTSIYVDIDNEYPYFSASVHYDRPMTNEEREKVNKSIEEARLESLKRKEKDLKREKKLYLSLKKKYGN